MKNNHGIPCSEESLKDWQQTWTDIQESIDLVMKYGEDLETTVEK